MGNKIVENNLIHNNQKLYVTFSNKFFKIFYCYTGLSKASFSMEDSPFDLFKGEIDEFNDFLEDVCRSFNLENTVRYFDAFEQFQQLGDVYVHFTDQLDYSQD